MEKTIKQTVEKTAHIANGSTILSNSQGWVTWFTTDEEYESVTIYTCSFDKFESQDEVEELTIFNGEIIKLGKLLEKGKK